MSVVGCRQLAVGYGAGPVVSGLDLEVARGEVVALLGPNGAGKTTTLMALAGALTPSDGIVTWQGEPTTAPMHRRARQGLGVVLEERAVTPSLTVRQNLRIGGVDPQSVQADFPELTEHLDRRAGLLSGGQQQLLTLARVLARRPVALLADELSLGLAPQVVARLLGAIRAAADDGLAVLLVEQHVRAALRVADRAVVLSRGRIRWSGPAAEARADPTLVEQGYLT
ncbi:ABC transporter ATP-binding protein [Frankia gtarii]|uniref:ABC transporter ATP-binding protein n=1 Tax=Frankia gtarii TaxID=2950102 RepID=UPI0021C0DAEA|nr:ATP-binding cassette domain-containing protein [Frankia gtarii]